MMLERDRRLKMEEERMERIGSLSPFISYRAISRTPELPPDRYEVSFSCRGLALKGDQLVQLESHKVMLYLHPNYPTQQPRIAWLTPIFHPNIKERTVCLGRSWTPAMTLDELCMILGEMIQYKLFNLDDPLNAGCAFLVRQILEENPDFVPIDTRNLLGPEVDFSLQSIGSDSNEQVVLD